MMDVQEFADRCSVAHRSGYFYIGWLRKLSHKTSQEAWAEADAEQAMRVLEAFIEPGCDEYRKLIACCRDIAATTLPKLAEAAGMLGDTGKTIMAAAQAAIEDATRFAEGQPQVGGWMAALNTSLVHKLPQPIGESADFALSSLRFLDHMIEDGIGLNAIVAQSLNATAYARGGYHCNEACRELAHLVRQHFPEPPYALMRAARPWYEQCPSSE